MTHAFHIQTSTAFPNISKTETMFNYESSGNIAKPYNYILPDLVI